MFLSFQVVLISLMFISVCETWWLPADTEWRLVECVCGRDLDTTTPQSLLHDVQWQRSCPRYFSFMTVRREEGVTKKTSRELPILNKNRFSEMFLLSLRMTTTKDEQCGWAQAALPEPVAPPDAGRAEVAAAAWRGEVTSWSSTSWGRFSEGCRPPRQNPGGRTSRSGPPERGGGGVCYSWKSPEWCESICSDDNQIHLN